jgi:hypothetical protein
MKNEKDYKVICISVYDEDLRRLDEIVVAMKRKGHRRASRSAVLRAAMKQFNPDLVPKGM